jgi:hypothetical protein
LRIRLLQARQRFIDGNHVGEIRVGSEQRLVDFDVLAAGAMLDTLVMARPFDQNAPHRQSRGCKEMTAAIPGSSLIGDTEVSLVHQRRRLQRLIRLPLTSEPRFASLRSSSYTSGNSSLELPGWSRGADVTRRRHYDT